MMGHVLHDWNLEEKRMLLGKWSSSMAPSRRIQFFASGLKYSRSMCVSLVEDEAVESLVGTLAEYLAT